MSVQGSVHTHCNTATKDTAAKDPRHRRTTARKERGGADRGRLTGQRGVRGMRGAREDALAYTIAY